MPSTSFGDTSYLIPGYASAFETLRPGCTWELTDHQMTAGEWNPGTPGEEDILKNVTRVGVGTTWSTMPTWTEIEAEVTREQAIYDYYAYERSRKAAHKPIEEQLDLLYHDIENGLLGAAATTGSWYVGITSVKTAHPKPEGDPPT